MAGNNNTPEIRFKGFTDPWEQRKLGELFEEYSDKDRADLPPLTIIQGGGTVYRDESNRNLQFDKNSLSNYKAVNPDDFIVHLRSFEGGLEKATCCGLISPAYHTFRGNSIDSDFYYLYFRSKRFIDTDLKPHVYGIRDGRSIDIDGMKTIPIPWTTVDEQRAIGGFFKDLDSLITLTSRKHEKLVQIKKAMLNKMFPAPGEQTPEIRFKGFTDPWEQRKLGDVAEIIGGGTPSTGVDEYWNGDIDWYSPAELGETNFVYGSERKITRAGYQNCSATMLPADKTILFTSRAGIGNTAILRRPGCTNQGFQSLVVNDTADVYFLYSMTDKIKKYAEQKASGSTFLEISGKSLAAGEFVFPSKAEQKAIGSYFAGLDHLITLTSRKLELLRNIKKAMLNKMFV